MDADLVVRLFGGPYVTAGSRRQEVPEGSKQLLAFVALRRRRVDRRQAAGTLWPDGDEERAAGNLRSALWRLRRAGIDVLLADKWSLALRPDVLVDVHLMDEWATRLIDGTAFGGRPRRLTVLGRSPGTSARLVRRLGAGGTGAPPAADTARAGGAEPEAGQRGPFRRCGGGGHRRDRRRATQGKRAAGAHRGIRGRGEPVRGSPQLARVPRSRPPRARRGSVSHLADRPGRRRAIAPVTGPPVPQGCACA